MDEEVFNLTLRQFLKMFGVTAQREIEQAVRTALQRGLLTGREKLPVQARLILEGAGLDVLLEGEIRLAESGAA